MTWGAFSALPDLERDLWLVKAEAEANRCKCGNDRTACSNPEHDWFPQRTVCYAEMEAQAANRRYDELHEAAPFHDGTFSNWSQRATATTPYHYRDGVSVWVAPVDLSPDDDFLTRQPRGGDRGDQA